MTIYTTVGFGNIYCVTPAGKWATVAYALLGIPLCLVVLAKLGVGCDYLFRRFYSAVKR